MVEALAALKEVGVLMEQSKTEQEKYAESMPVEGRIHV